MHKVVKVKVKRASINLDQQGFSLFAIHMPQNDYIEEHIKKHGRPLDYHERKYLKSINIIIIIAHDNA